ncbi:MAG TPA: hypothetical protein VG713_21765 [Pirellulales bacterium]|nr:hypothetical protein [Pirellulales bacterium]
MPTYFILYDDETIEHLAKHHVLIEEFEQVVSNPQWTEPSKTSDNMIAFGHTAAGRFLACVYEQIDDTHILAITAYEV